jgi:hypothetical protein
LFIQVIQECLKKFDGIPEIQKTVDQYREEFSTDKTEKDDCPHLDILIQIMSILGELNKDWSQSDFELQNSSCPVYYCTRRKIFIKLLQQVNFDKYKTEVEVLQLLNNQAIPKLVNHGSVSCNLNGTFFFIVTEECILPPHDRPIPMSTLAREHQHIINKEHLIVWSAELLSAIHGFPIKSSGGNFINWVKEMQKGAMDNHCSMAYFPQSLVAKIPAYIDGFVMKENQLVSGIMHGDFTVGNVLGHYHVSDSIYGVEWKPSNLIDFGDSMVGLIDPLYDITTIFVTLLKCDVGDLCHFLSIYGNSFSQLSWKEFRYRIMIYIILYPSECISREFCRILFIKFAKWTDNITWEWVESTIFPEDDLRLRVAKRINSIADRAVASMQS